MKYTFVVTAFLAVIAGSYSSPSPVGIKKVVIHHLSNIGDTGASNAIATTTNNDNYVYSSSSLLDGFVRVKRDSDPEERTFRVRVARTAEESRYRIMITEPSTDKTSVRKKRTVNFKLIFLILRFILKLLGIDTGINLNNILESFGGGNTKDLSQILQ